MHPDDAPLVSVIVTTYNRPTYLVDAVESVRGQSYPNVEILVVDDASDLPASEVLGDAPDCTVIRHAENRGANAARNTGIEAATGDRIAFLDDDDTWAPEKLARQAEVFDADPDTVLVYTGSQSVDDDGGVVARFRPTIRGDVTTALFAGAQIGGFSLVMVRRSAIDAAGTLDERFPSWQDREWYVRLSTVGRFDYVDAPLVTHRSPLDQISNDFERKRDVSYPLFLAKHRPLAASYGRRHERRFVASLSHTLGASALRCGYYRDAVRFLSASLRARPASPRTAAYLLLALGGSRTYGSVQKVKHDLTRSLSGRGS